MLLTGDIYIYMCFTNRLKHEIEHIQHLLEKSRLRLQNDFQTWLDTIRRLLFILHSIQSTLHNIYHVLLLLLLCCV